MATQYKYTYAAWAEAFTIFAKYSTDDDYAEVAAEHDVFYGGGKKDKMSQEDQDRLEELGWSWGEYECWEKNV